MKGRKKAGNVVTALLLILTSGLACKAPPDTDLVVLTASDSSFATILTDLHLTDAQSYLAAQERSDLTSADFEARDSVLAAHGTTEIEFMDRVEQLLADPQRLLAIYSLVLDQTPRQ